MQTMAVESVRTKMENLRRACDSELAIHSRKVDSAVDSFGRCLQSLRSRAQHSAQNQVELGKCKAQLREVEDELVKALAVKTRKEAKRMAIVETLSETRVKVDELRKIVQDQEVRRDEYAAILSQQLKALADAEEKSKQASRHKEEIQEAFTWYNRVLGFRIDGGHGVKFTFTNINRKYPTKEYSFTVRHSNDVYTLLDCNPPLNDIEDLVNNLNKSNGLFSFVRSMRDKFQAEALGSVFKFIHHDEESRGISVSAPVSSISTDSTGDSLLPLRESSIKINKSPFLSPMSASNLRRSPRFQVDN